jgi:hypothetical protein
MTRTKANRGIFKVFIFPCLIGLILTGSASAGYFDWMDNIDESCNATIKGRAKAIFSKHGFWMDTAVSMEMWIDDVRTDNPQAHCYIAPHIKNDPVKLQQCLAFTKHRVDWYVRCKPVVDMMVKRSFSK